MNWEEMDPRESQQRDTRKKVKCKKSGQDFEIRGEEMERETLICWLWCVSNYVCFCVSLRVFAERPNREEGRDGNEIGVRVEIIEGVVVIYRAGQWNLSHFTFSF